MVDAIFVLANKGGRESLEVESDSTSTYTIDLDVANAFDLTLTDDCTLTFDNAQAGVLCSFSLWLRQDATGGRTVTWPASVVWSEGTAPTLSTAASTYDILVFMTVDGGTTWEGFLSGKDMS